MSDESSVSSTPPSHYVGIGASAGGLEAIESLFVHMPADSGAAFIVIQHLSPDYKSLMTELLSKRTEMSVNRAVEGMLVEPNQVYLIPPNYDMRIFHGRLHLKEQDRSGGLNLPIDTFFNSLAEDQGDKVVGIVLSGTGSDGSRGVRSIKENVGMVMVQSEESAAFDGMPRSAIATGMVDYIITPEEMPGQLQSYIQHPYASKIERSDSLLTDEEGLARIFLMLREKKGVDFTYYKPSTVIRRIERRMTVNQAMDLRAYVRIIENDPKEVELLHKDLLIGVTSFFRDREPFQLLVENWLMELIQSKSEKQSGMRIWVAGCSTGEEAYTLAILCQEVMSRLNTLINIKIFATDVDQDAVNKAGQGVFNESIVAEIPREYLGKYFHRREGGYQVSRSLREMVVFAQHNLIKDPPFTNMDVISCRNLLIYLQGNLQSKVLELFNFSLNKGGILLLGASESVGEFVEYFTPVDRKWKVYRSEGKKRQGVLSESALTIDSTGHVVRGKKGQLMRLPFTDRHDERVVERLLQGITGTYLPFTVVVNEQMELLHVAGDSSPYLKFPAGKMVNNVSKLAHADLGVPIATGIQRVLKEESEVVYSNVHVRHDGGMDAIISLRFLPLPRLRGQESLIAILIEESQPKIKTDSENSLEDDRNFYITDHWCPNVTGQKLI